MNRDRRSNGMIRKEEMEEGTEDGIEGGGIEGNE